MVIYIMILQRLLHGMIKFRNKFVLKNEFKLLTKNKNNINIKIKKEINNLASIKIFENWIKFRNITLKSKNYLWAKFT